MSGSPELTAQQVVDYLQHTPDFFAHHSFLLETLTLPNPSHGNVISLVAKQLEIFRVKHQKLEAQLTDLLAIARDNEVCAHRMHQLTLALMNATCLESALIHLKQGLTVEFGIDFVALKIIIEYTNSALADYLIVPWHEKIDYLNVELQQGKPRCGRLNAAQMTFLFADSAAQIHSCAIIPIFSANLTALLVLGSRDQNRFHYTQGDLFLTQLGEIVGTRLASLLKAAQPI